MSRLLDALVFGLRAILSNGAAVPQRTQIDFRGPGVTIADDPANDATRVTISGGSGGGTDAYSIKGQPISGDPGDWTDGDVPTFAAEANEFELRHMVEMVSVPTADRLPRIVSGGFPTRVVNSVSSEDSSGNYAVRAMVSGTTGMTPRLPPIGNLDFSLLPAGSFVGVCVDTTAQRGMQSFQINSGAQSARVQLYKAEGTPDALLVPTTNGRGIGRLELRAWDGSVFQDVGFLDWEVATAYNRSHGSGGVISGTLPAVRSLLKAEGPCFAANNSGTGTLATPISHTWYFNGSLASAAPATALASVTLEVPIQANTSTILGIHIIGRGQTSGDMYHRVLQLGLKRVSTGDPVLYASNPLDDLLVVRDDATWASAYAVNTTTDALALTLTSDASETVKWTIHVYELAVPFPP